MAGHQANEKSKLTHGVLTAVITAAFLKESTADSCCFSVWGVARTALTRRGARVRLLDVHPCWLKPPCNRPIVAAILILAVGQPCLYQGVAQHTGHAVGQVKHLLTDGKHSGSQQYKFASVTLSHTWTQPSRLRKLSQHLIDVASALQPIPACCYSLSCRRSLPTRERGVTT